MPSCSIFSNPIVTKLYFQILSELIGWLDSMTEAERKRVSDICFATTGKRNFPNDRQFIHDLKARYFF